MKVSASVRTIHQELSPRYKALEERVENLLKGKKDKRWHYEGRVKTLESYALKLETGRVRDPLDLEDFFACTLVVPNAEEVARATKLVEDEVVLLERRPPDPKRTHKLSEWFPFDDLRLYCRWKDLGPETGLADLRFEVQVKTFLQHAWGIATHDLIYKNNEKNWGKERIAYQVKAMLEHAEVAIQQAPELARCEGLSLTNDVSDEVSKVIDWLRHTWTASLLPDNQKLLAENLLNLFQFLGLPPEESLSLLTTEAAAGLPTNLSPYGFVLQVLLQKKLNRFVGGFDPKSRNRKFVLIVPAEIEVPSGLSSAPAGRLIWLGSKAPSPPRIGGSGNDDASVPTLT